MVEGAAQLGIGEKAPIIRETDPLARGKAVPSVKGSRGRFPLDPGGSWDGGSDPRRVRGENVQEDLAVVVVGFRELGYPYWTAPAQIDRAEWLAKRGRLDDPASAAAEAALILENTGAASMLSRCRALLEPEMTFNSAADSERAPVRSYSLPSG